MFQNHVLNTALTLNTAHAERGVCPSLADSGWYWGHVQVTSTCPPQTAALLHRLHKLNFRVNCRAAGLRAARLLRASKYKQNDIKEITWDRVTGQKKGWRKSPCRYTAFPSGNKASTISHSSLLAQAQPHIPSQPPPSGASQTKSNTQHLPARLAYIRNFTNLQVFPTGAGDGGLGKLGPFTFCASWF